MAAFLSSQLQAGDYCNTVWRIREAPADTAVETLLKPETWSHCARSFKPYDEVIVIPQGGPYRAHLIVMDAGANFAKMRLLGVTLLNAGAAEPESEAALPDDAPVEVSWKGPKLKYAVTRKADGERLRTGFAIKAEAEAWARTHLLAMA